MKLLYRPDFWSFYNDNRTEIDYIINYFSHRYYGLVDADDMFQEILLRLANSDLLIKYDSKKGSLNTYFTHKVRGYSSHYAKEISKRPYFIPIEYYIASCEKDIETDKYNRIKNHIDYKTRPTFNETINNSLYSEEIMDILKERLDKTHYLIACLYLLDCYTCKEICQYIDKFSYNTIVKKINDIKSLIDKIINSHYYMPIRSSKSVSAI